MYVLIPCALALRCTVWQSCVNVYTDVYTHVQNVFNNFFLFYSCQVQNLEDLDRLLSMSDMSAGEICTNEHEQL